MAFRRPTLLPVAASLALAMVLGPAFAADPPPPGGPKGEAASAKGKVAGYTLTPKGDVDGFLLDDGTQVRVPPHLSAALVFTARPGDAVTVTGERRRESPVIEAREVRNDASGAVLDEPAPGGGKRGRDAREAGPMRVDGKVRFALRGPKGELDGAVLEDGTVLRVPPREAGRDAAKLAPGQTVRAEGPGRTTPMGRVVEVKKLD